MGLDRRRNVLRARALYVAVVKNAERIDKSIETMFGDQFLDND